MTARNGSNSSFVAPSISPQKPTTQSVPKEEREVAKPKHIPIVAGKAPVSGASMGSAYFLTLAAGQYNSMKSNLDTSRLQTAAMQSKAAEARAIQSTVQSVYRPSHVVSNIGLEAKASFYEAIGKYNGVVSLSDNAKNAFSITGSVMAGKAQGALSRNDDMGNQIASGAIGAGVAGYTGFKVAQAASPLAINAVQNIPTAANKIAAIGAGAWDVTTTAGKATVALAKTASIMRSGFIPLTSPLTKNILHRQAEVTGLLHTATSQRIISSVNQIQSRIANIRTGVSVVQQGIKTGITTATNAAKRSYTLVRGIATGTTKMSAIVSHATLKRIGDMAKVTSLRGMNLVGRGMAHGMVKGGVWTFKSGLPKGIKGMGNASLGIAGMMASADDMMLQGVGNSVMLANYGIRTSIVAGRFTGRVVQTSVKGGVGAAKATYGAASFIKNKGLRAAWSRARNKMATAAANAGKSVVNAAINLVKMAGRKVVVPIILIVAVGGIIFGFLSAPAVSVGSIFSGLFDRDNGDGTYTEMDIRAFITDPSFGIPVMRADYIQELYDHMQSQKEENGGAYDYVRFKTNSSDEVVEPTISGISSVFYTEDELADIIQPIFNAVILKDYELAPTEDEAKAILQEIFDKLFRTDEVPSVEHCGQSAIDGSGEPLPAHSCGSIHALADCPNHVTGTHGSYTCSTCCYYYCNGHSDGNGGTTHCSGCIHACSGYDYCGGHDVLTVILYMDGLYQLLDEYFEQPIDELSSIADRTEEQEAELSLLKDSYEICLEYIKQVAVEYGGGLTMEDLSGVVWINGTRRGNQEIIDIALSQVGQVGGQPYWSWYGFDSRVEWCACYVSWCMNQIGHTEIRYAACQSGGIPIFQSMGQWASGGYTDLVAGDVIFFDWEGDGQANHTGLVIGTDGTYVYTVEGNSGDACRMKQYPLNSSVIMGYGLMNY